MLLEPAGSVLGATQSVRSIRWPRNAYILEALCKRHLISHGHLDLGRLPKLRLLFDQSEVDVVVLGFASDTQSSRLEAGEKDPHELAETCRVENGYSLARASGSVVRVNSSTRYRALSFGANLVDPASR